MKSLISRIAALFVLLNLTLAPAPPTLAAQQPAAAPLALGTNIEHIGHTGGSTSRVVSQGTYAYLGRGSDLVVIDISVPTRPLRIGKLRLLDQVSDIALVGGTRVYIAAGRAGLRIVDATDPAALVELGSFITADPAVSVAVAGNRAFLATQQALSNTGYPPYGVSTLYTLDVANPAAPAAIYTSEHSGYLDNLKLDGQFLYTTLGTPGIIGGSGRLQVFDVTDVAAPQLAGSTEFGGFPGPLTLAGPRAYLIASARLGVWMTIIDLIDPHNPTLQGVFGGGVSIGLGEPVANGGLVYLPSSKGMFTVDVTDPQNPRQINLFPQIPLGAITHIADTLAIADGGGFSIVSIADPAALKIIAAYPLLGLTSNLAVEAQRAYVADYSGHTWAIDVSTPGSPRELGFLNQGALQMVPRNGYLYLASGDQGLQIADFRDPSRPRVVGRYVSSGVAGVALNGNVAYLAQNTSMKVIDIGDPTHPRLLADRRDLALNGQMQLVGTHLYALAYITQPALLILDVADAARPKLIGRYDGAFDLLGVDGTSVYVNDAQNNLLQLDANTPSTPTMRANYGLPNVVKQSVIGRYLYARSYLGGTYASSYLGGAHVFDIGTPSRVREVASDPTIYTSDLVGANGLLYIADIERGLNIVQQRLAIRGYVADPNGTPAAGVTITSGTASAQTDATGAYTLTNLLGGTLTLTPTQGGYRFAPETRTISLGADLEGQNFIRLPAPVSATVAPGQAATLGYADAQGQRAELAIPASALPQGATLTLTPTLDRFAPGMASTGHAFMLGGASSFAAPLTVTIGYGDADVRAITDESALELQWWDGGAWRAPNCAGTISHDLAQNSIAAPICAPGEYRLVGPTHQLLLPLVMP